MPDSTASTGEDSRTQSDSFATLALYKFTYLLTVTKGLEVNVKKQETANRLKENQHQLTIIAGIWQISNSRPIPPLGVPTA